MNYWIFIVFILLAFAALLALGGLLIWAVNKLNKLLWRQKGGKH